MKGYLKNILLMTVIAVFSVSAFAQDEAPEGWKKSLVVEFLTTQAAYSGSWVGGEVGSFNWTGNMNGSAERMLSPTMNFKSTLKLKFGQTITQDEEGNWSKPKKSDDLIDWENVLKYMMKIHVDPYVAFRLESKFLDASHSQKKYYFNPMTLTESAGLSKKLFEKEKEHVTSRAGFAIRQLINKALYVPDSTNPSVYTEETESATDGGLEWVTDAELQFKENLKYTGKLTVFKALFYSEKDKLKGTEAEDYWKAIDINWENQIDAQITKVITVGLYTQVLYDKEISKKGRFKETLGIGFKYTLF